MNNPLDPDAPYNRLDPDQNPLAYLRKFFDGHRYLITRPEPEVEVEAGISVYRFEDFHEEVSYERVALDPTTATLLDTDFPCYSLLHTCADCRAADPFVCLEDPETVYAVLAHCTHRHFTQGRRRNLAVRRILRERRNWVPPDSPRVRECLGGLMVVKLRRVAGASSPFGFAFESMPPDSVGESLAARVVLVWLQESIGDPLRMIYLVPPISRDPDFGVAYLAGPYTHHPPRVRAPDREETSESLLEDESRDE
ncbi:hypothetical protein C8F01DRAFT_1093492 [Mycena amicta]|nr:hypothetical protein C8F01DRAFT_1093492 [Mycena amicta]